MTPKVIPFHPGHLTVIETRPHEMFTQLDKWQELLAEIAETGFAFTLVAEGRVILCGGITQSLPGNAQAWLLPSSYINTYKLTAAKVTKQVLDDLMETHQLHRIGTACQITPLYDEWMKYLGFEPEGIQLQAGVNRTDLMGWGKVRKD